MNNKYSMQPRKITKYQSGVVLVISLIMLLALTLIGVTSSNVTGLEEKMAANSKDVNLAFQAAEAALRFVETNRLGPNQAKLSFDHASADTAQGTDGLYSNLSACDGTTTTNATQRAETTPSIRPFYENVDWNATTNIKYKAYENGSASTTKLVGLAQEPRYIIEEINCIKVQGGGSSESLGAAMQATTSTGETITMRITAHGWGSNINSVATVQSVVKVTYQN